MEKQIDEVCRMLRDYIETGNGDVKLMDSLFDTMIKITNDAKSYRRIAYFTRSLRREIKEPEVMNRDQGSRAIYHRADYKWRGY